MVSDAPTCFRTRFDYYFLTSLILRLRLFLVTKVFFFYVSTVSSHAQEVPGCDCWTLVHAPRFALR